MMYNIKWDTVATLPVSVSGAFCGISNDMLIVAGGSNFPDAKPWEGGKKKYWNKIYVIDIKNHYQLASTDDTLMNKTAYGASVNVADGLLCIGGENENGVLKDVFLLRWNTKEKKIEKEIFPSLPVALTSCSACLYQSKIFLAGGDNGKESGNSFYELDMQSPKLNWQELPSIPISVSFSTSAVINKSGVNVLLIGGREKKQNAVSVLHNSIYAFDISSKKWNRKKDIPNIATDTANLSAGCIINIDNRNIILIGGDNGKIFSLIEQLNSSIEQETDVIKKEKLFKQKLELIHHHPGFSKNIFLFNTINNTWKKISELPYSPVTTTAVLWNNQIFIAGGEIKPGERTNLILRGTIITKHL